MPARCSMLGVTRRPEPEHLPHRESVRWQSRFRGRGSVPHRGRASNAGSHLHGQGKHPGSHIFTTSDMTTLVVLFFFSVGSGPPCVGQEASTDKRIREDLYKKVVSGDPVAARLPYAILMKRLEMNETLKFYGVSEMTFPSIMRRSLIINCTGRFVSAQRLASLSPGTQGYFLVQEGTKDFVTSQPAAGALFTVVLGELCDCCVATF